MLDEYEQLVIFGNCLPDGPDNRTAGLWVTIVPWSAIMRSLLATVAVTTDFSWPPTLLCCLERTVFAV